jgi:hypothetical protein
VSVEVPGKPIICIVWEIKLRQLLGKCGMPHSVEGFAEVKTQNDNKLACSKHAGDSVQQLYQCCCGGPRRPERILIIERKRRRSHVEGGIQKVTSNGAFHDSGKHRSNGYRSEVGGKGTATLGTGIIVAVFH